jgi:hypothetical protein
VRAADGSKAARRAKGKFHGGRPVDRPALCLIEDGRSVKGEEQVDALRDRRQPLVFVDLYQYMLMHMMRAWNPTSCWPALLASALPSPSLAVHAQALPTRVVEPHLVELTLPAEALVEAVNQATLAAQVSGRVVEVRSMPGRRCARAIC